MPLNPDQSSNPKGKGGRKAQPYWLWVLWEGFGVGLGSWSLCMQKNTSQSVIQAPGSGIPRNYCGKMCPAMPPSPASAPAPQSRTPKIWEAAPEFLLGISASVFWEVQAPILSRWCLYQAVSPIIFILTSGAQRGAETSWEVDVPKLSLTPAATAFLLRCSHLLDGVVEFYLPLPKGHSHNHRDPSRVSVALRSWDRRKNSGKRKICLGSHRGHAAAVRDKVSRAVVATLPTPSQSPAEQKRHAESGEVCISSLGSLFS